MIMEKSREDSVAQRARQRRLGLQLRQLYDDVISEEIPDDFLRLLEEADKSSEATSGRAGGANASSSQPEK